MIPIGETRDGRSDMTNFEMDLFDTRMASSRTQETEEKTPCGKNGFIKPACLPISIIAIFIFMVIFFPMLNDDYFDVPVRDWETTGQCTYDCRIHLVESIPQNLTYAPTQPLHMSTYSSWADLVKNAKSTIDIASYYWTLRAKDIMNISEPSANEGEEIFELLRQAGERGIKIRIAQNAPTEELPSLDSAELARDGLAEVRNINFTHLFGGGVLHTKFIIVDDADFYLGSANMDWRALTQVKELGVYTTNCPCLVQDLWKIFEIYWKMGEPGAELPKKWPFRLRTAFNARTPLNVTLNDTKYMTYFSSSPPAFSPKGREPDLDAILHTINESNEHISIAVMDYAPVFFYTKQKQYWPIIDDALRAAAFERGVHVKILMSKWSHTRKAEFAYLNSLIAINPALEKGSIKVRLFEVPATMRQKLIPFARVNHNKYMVTEKTAQICTSNWAGDYFTVTAGVSMVVRRSERKPFEFVRSPDLVSQLNDIFERDWNSDYAKPMEP